MDFSQKFIYEDIKTQIDGLDIGILGKYLDTENGWKCNIIDRGL